MISSRSFWKTVCALAIPVALQSMLQSSFSIVDQIMIGQLGSISVAGVGLAGKFSSIFSVISSAIGAVAGIMLSQYLGQKNHTALKRSFYVNLFLASGLAAAFTLLCAVFPQRIMGLYTKDPATVQAASAYLVIIASTFLPLAGATLLSTLLRCVDRPRLPLYANIVATVFNTALNYILIFGKLGFAPMGAQGAAIATAVSQWVNFLLMLAMTHLRSLLPSGTVPNENQVSALNLRQYLAMLLPILVCEVVWSLGENVYAAIYGHMGTDVSAAMTLTTPVQGLMIGALCGLSQAAGVIIGKALGSRDYSLAYAAAKKLILYGAVGSLLLSGMILLLSGYYVQFYQVEETVRSMARHILTAYALVAPFKVLNMILGGGILRSGGRTRYVMVIDILGTWGFGVPLGLLSAFVWKLPIPGVYFCLSLEECVRFVISLAVFRRKSWMANLDGTASTAISPDTAG